jgi:hypothetical protein
MRPLVERLKKTADEFDAAIRELSMRTSQQR